MSILVMSEQAVAPSTPSAGKVASYFDSNGILLVVGDNASSYVACGPILLPDQPTSSGTAINVTGVPSWVRIITVNTIGFSTNGTSMPMIRLGDSGGVETNAYNGSAVTLSPGAITTVPVSSGFMLSGSWANTVVGHGQIVLVCQSVSSNTWSCNGVVASTIGSMSFGTGSKALSAPLDRIQLTTLSGAQTFTAGVLSVVYE